jgi:hypothetical protein
MSSTLTDKLTAGDGGILLYGIVPPKRSSTPDELISIAAHQTERINSLPVDGLVVYDIQDEADRIAAPRPFPFLPTIEPDAYAHDFLRSVKLPKIVYRRTVRDTPESFVRWVTSVNASAEPQLAVFVGVPSKDSHSGLPLTQAYELARQHAPKLLVGGIAIAERHARRLDEHERVLAKTAQGCRFFVTQAVYDATSTMSMLSDYAIAVRERGGSPKPFILTFSPCGSPKTLAFMKWLGISFPRWLENDLVRAADTLTKSLELCERIFVEVWDYAREKGIPLGVNIESVSIRKVEIEASVELVHRLRRRMDSIATTRNN